MHGTIRRRDIDLSSQSNDEHFQDASPEGVTRSIRRYAPQLKVKLLLDCKECHRDASSKEMSSSLPKKSVVVAKCDERLCAYSQTSQFVTDIFSDEGRLCCDLSAFGRAPRDATCMERAQRTSNIHDAFLASRSLSPFESRKVYSRATAKELEPGSAATVWVKLTAVKTQLAVEGWGAEARAHEEQAHDVTGGVGKHAFEEVLHVFVALTGCRMDFRVVSIKEHSGQEHSMYHVTWTLHSTYDFVLTSLGIPTRSSTKGLRQQDVQRGLIVHERRSPRSKGRCR